MTENKQDTITVELPIKTRADGRVSVCGLRYTREYWREVAASPDQDLTSILAPAVVAWIERDEWEPLDLPDEGRTIKATMRDGRVETFKVGVIGTGRHSEWTGVWKADSDDGVRFIQRVRDVHNPGPRDIIAWEYVDEPAESEPEDTHTVTVTLQADLSGFADSLQAAADAIREASK